MPRVSRRPHRRRAEYGPDDIRLLLRGYSWFGALTDRHGDIDMAAAAEAWESLRDDLLPAYIADHPGQRPWAWWAFDATEPRRCVSGPGLRAATDETLPARVRRLSFGRPCCYFAADMEGEQSVYETQAAYLARMRLLSAAERKAIALLPDGAPEYP
jgi:hypothetical protein